MPPPAKKQKRRVVLSSDDEGPDAKSTRKPIPTRSRANAIESDPGRSGTAARPGPGTLPKDRAAKPKPADKAPTSRPISSFFSAGIQAQQSNGQELPGVATPEVEDHEDLIEDDSGVENVDDPGAVSTKLALDRRKKHPAPAFDHAAATDRRNLQGGGQSFKIPRHASSMGASPGASGAVKARSNTLDQRPWAEQYGPDNLEDLMVHKRKVSDVRSWLENVLRGHGGKRLLILKGPSGAGKTATISTLAKAMGVDVSEWKNPVGSEFSSEAYLPMSAHFEDFLSRSGNYKKLALAEDTTGNGSATPSSTIDALGEMARPRIILMEEFPNTFLSTSSALRSFRSSVLQYLAFGALFTNVLPPQKRWDNLRVTPVVMIITETRLTTTTAASDSFTAHRLLGPELLSHPGVSTIEFNPVASTYLTKALDIVVRKEARQSGRRRVPGPAVLKKLGEVGDIRSAIGSLEFLCLRGEHGDGWGGRVASRAKTGAHASSALTTMETESLEMVTQRESTLGLFHAVGKVVYNKRDDFFADGEAARRPPTQPPDHLSGHARPRTSQVSADRLIDETGTDVATFIAALHENFALSCAGSSFTHHVNGCIDALSDSDVLGAPRGARYGSSGDYGNNRSFQGAPSDALRQEEMCFQIAVRGLLFALPDPVKRRTHPMTAKSGGKDETHQMFYPTSMRLSRQMEEMDGLVGQWTDRLRARGVSVGNPTDRHGRHITHWPSRQEQGSTVNVEDRSQPDEDNPEPFRTNLGCTKSEMIAERLPYMTMIERRNAAFAHLDGLERVTRFHGITPAGDEALDDEDVGEGALVSDWTTDSPAGGNGTGLAPRASLQQTVERASSLASTLVPPVAEDVGQLYLSDDDIEDD